jgi:hypothetical protein
LPLGVFLAELNFASVFLSVLYPSSLVVILALLILD